MALEVWGSSVTGESSLCVGLGWLVGAPGKVPATWRHGDVNQQQFCLSTITQARVSDLSASMRQDSAFQIKHVSSSQDRMFMMLLRRCCGAVELGALPPQRCREPSVTHIPPLSCGCVHVAEYVWLLGVQSGDRPQSR